MPIPIASVTIATAANTGRLASVRKLKQILHQNVQKITGDRFAAFFFKPLMASELDPRATLAFGATQPGTFQIIRSKLDVCAKFLLQFVLRLGATKESCG